MAAKRGRLGISIGSHAAACITFLTKSPWQLVLFERGDALEKALSEGAVDAVLELNLVDLDDDTHNSRLTSAAIQGIPQVIVPAGLSDHLDADAMDHLGKQIAMKASASRGPVWIVIPKGTDEFLLKSLRLWLSPDVKVIEAEAEIGEERFADMLIRCLGHFIPQ